MFKALIEMFRKEGLLHQAYTDSLESLKIDKLMFDEARRSLRESDTAELALDVFAMDAKINEYQRHVRSKVLAHLALTTSKDPVFGLVLVSVIIDIERIGDYTKNIVELAQQHPKKLHAGPLEDCIGEIETNISDLFDKLIEAFEKKDDELARAIMQRHRDSTQPCDQVLETLLKDEHPEFSTAEAVNIALYARYLKRISSHITNIASGIVNPFDRIGYKENNKK
jgi:phosphate uptake regulator